MTTLTHRLKEGDLLPALEVDLIDGDGAAVDLSDIGSVHFHMAGPGIDPIDRAAVVVDAEAGTVRYDWQAGDTDKAGLYRAEFEVISGGKPTTFPNDRDIVIRIRKDVD